MQDVTLMIMLQKYHGEMIINIQKRYSKSQQLIYAVSKISLFVIIASILTSCTSVGILKDNI